MSALQSRINESIEQKPEVNARNKAIQVSSWAGGGFFGQATEQFWNLGGPYFSGCGQNTYRFIHLGRRRANAGRCDLYLFELTLSNSCGSSLLLVRLNVETAVF